MTRTEICASIIDAEREAARIMLATDHVTAQVKTGSRDIVTEFDCRVQQLLEKRFRSLFPDACFFCEEMNEQGSLSADHVFIIDPIDGTMNFARGFGRSCISVAYAEKGELVCSAVYNPYLDEMFHAVKGNGAYLNGNRIFCPDSPLSDSIVCFGTSPYYEELSEKSFDMAHKLFLNSLDIRREGSAELDLCSVACGRAGLYFELRISLWDYAAGMLIVKEAGGDCRTLDNTQLPFDGSRSCIVAGGTSALADYFNIFPSYK